MNKERFYLLDGLRGLTLLSMIAYHGMYDLVMIYHMPWVWFWTKPGYVWQQSICWTFILLSGFCWRMGRNPVKRGLTIFAGGLIITAVTYIFMPSGRILFGILTFTGTAMLALVPLFRWLQRIPAAAGLLGSGILFFLTRNINDGYLGFESIILGKVPEGLYQGMFMTFLGFPEPGFFSGDYFSFFPWIFLYLCGYFLYEALMQWKSVKKVLKWRVPVLEWIGRNTLAIYMLHQPVLMVIFECIF